MPYGIMRKDKEFEINVFLDCTPSPCAVIAPNGDVLLASQQLASSLGYSRKEIEHLTLHDLTESCSESTINQLFQTDSNQPVLTKTISLRKKCTSSFKQPIRIQQITYPKSQVPHLFLTLDNQLTKNLPPKAFSSIVSRITKHDSLTGLANRNHCLAHLQTCIEVSKESLKDENSSPVRYAMLFVNLDGFKSINVSLGHIAGDEVLNTIATRIGEAAGENAFIARMNSDEFVVIYQEVQSETSPSIKIQAENLAQTINDAIYRPISIKNKEAICSASIGIVCFPKDGGSPEMLLRNADIALYHAKKKGQNCHATFDVDMERRLTRKMSLAGRLRKAINQDNFTIFYQPKFCLKTMRIQGVEALARWFTGSGEAISPGEFIPIIESSGMAYDFGEYFLEKACSEFKQLYKNTDFNSRLAVNISTLQFTRPTHVCEILANIVRTSFPAEYLELEITESAIIQNLASATKTIKALQEENIHIALDDFGVGYSSLSHLQKLPVNTIKLDKTFVDEIHVSEKSRIMTSCIVDLAKNLNLNIVAEGIETLDQLCLLQRMGCHGAQGFYLSKPISFEKTRQLIENNVANSIQKAKSISQYQQDNKLNQAI